MNPRLLRLLTTLLDPRSYLHAVRMLNFWNYAHVMPRRRMVLGAGVQISPTVSLRNGERISIGDHAHVGEFSSLWAGDTTGAIRIGHHALLGPRVFLTASNYMFEPDRPVMDQPRVEADVVIGDDAWLGAGVIVLAGVTVGSGCVVAAGAVVTRDLAPGSVAAGVPARVIRQRATV